MIPGFFAIVGSLIAVSGDLYYLYCTVRGTVQPNRVTWLLWGLFPAVAFVAQLSQDVGLVIFATLASCAIPLLVFIVSSLNPKAYWKISRQDYLFAAIAILGLILWQVTDNANLAIGFAVLADLAAGFPTIIKSYTNPETENWRAYALAGVGFLIAALSVQVVNFENLAFVVYVCAFNVLATSVIVWRQYIVR